jgi:hypothetical protein
MAPHSISVGLDRVWARICAGFACCCMRNTFTKFPVIAATAIVGIGSLYLISLEGLIRNRTFNSLYMYKKKLYNGTELKKVTGSSCPVGGHPPPIDSKTEVTLANVQTRLTLFHMR